MPVSQAEACDYSMVPAPLDHFLKAIIGYEHLNSFTVSCWKLFSLLEKGTIDQSHFEEPIMNHFKK